MLDGIPPAPRGMPQIEVTFDIDANGIINVTALDKATSRSQHITITASSGLSESEVKKMKQEAEVHADEDRKRKELVELRNNGDNTVYTAEKLLRENGDKVPADLNKEVEDGIAKVRTVLGGDDAEAIRTSTEGLNQVVQKIGAAMYQQQPQTPPQTPPESGPAGDGKEGPSKGGDDVVDGEFKSV